MVHIKICTQRPTVFNTHKMKAMLFSILKPGIFVFYWEKYSQCLSTLPAIAPYLTG